jgi:hypothetical protein
MENQEIKKVCDSSMMFSNTLAAIILTVDSKADIAYKSVNSPASGLQIYITLLAYHRQTHHDTHFESCLSVGSTEIVTANELPLGCLYAAILPDYSMLCYSVRLELLTYSNLHF